MLMTLRPAVCRPLVAGLALAVLAGCGTVKSPTEPAPGAGAQGPAFTFSRIQSEIFSPICGQAGCHDVVTAQNGMVLSAGFAYANIVNHPVTEASGFLRIVPGDPDHSYLVKKIRGDPDILGERMPRIGGPLSQAQIDGIVGWVRAGALNN
jgi:hypothetical protein